MGKKIICIIALVVGITGVIMFLFGSIGGTIEGYKGADGQYYSNPGAVGSLEWMCAPGFVMGIVGGVVFIGTKDSFDKK